MIFFFLKAQMVKFFEFLIGICPGYFKKMQTSAFLRPLPPRVGKRLQLGTPSPPKNCGHPLWTAPLYNRTCPYFLKKIFVNFLTSTLLRAQNTTLLSKVR